MRGGRAFMRLALCGGKKYFANKARRALMREIMRAALLYCFTASAAVLPDRRAALYSTQTHRRLRARHDCPTSGRRFYLPQARRRLRTRPIARRADSDFICRRRGGAFAGFPQPTAEGWAAGRTRGRARARKTAARVRRKNRTRATGAFRRRGSGEAIACRGEGARRASTAAA